MALEPTELDREFQLDFSYRITQVLSLATVLKFIAAHLSRVSVANEMHFLKARTLYKGIFVSLTKYIKCTENAMKTFQ